MKNKLYIIVGMALMAVLAIISARILQEPVQPDNSNQPPSQILNDEVPLTQVPETSPQDQGVASLVSDRVAGSAEVTEAPQNRQPLSNIVLNDPSQTQAAEKLPELPTLDLPGPNISSRPESQISGLPTANSEPAARTETASPVAASASQTEQTASASTQATSASNSQAANSNDSAGNTSASSNQAANVSTATGTSSNASNVSSTQSSSNTLTTRSKLPSETGKNVIINARLNLDGENINLRLEGNGPLSGKAFSLSGPDRAVLDLEGTWKLSSPTVPSNRMLGAIRVGQQDKATRLVLDMRVKPQTVEVVRIGANVIELRVR